MPDVTVTINTIEKGSQNTKRATENLKNLKQETKALVPGLENARSELTKFATTNAGLIGILVGVGVALKKTYDIAREGAALEFTIGKFDRLSESIGTTSEALLRDLKEATRGIYSDMELMASATDLVALGLAKDHEEAVRLAAVSGGLNMNMNQLVLTLTNMTTMRFDALGVSVDGFKEKVAELEAQGYSANDAFKEAFLQQAEMQLEKVGHAADSSLGSFMRLEAGIRDMTDRAKRSVSEGLEPLVDALADQVERENEYSAALDKRAYYLEQAKEQLREETGQVNISTMQASALAAELQRDAEAAEALAEATGETLAPALEITAEDIAKLTKANQDYLREVGNLTDALDTFQDKERDLQTTHAELITERDKLISTYPWEVEKIDELNKKIAENETAQMDNATEFELATRRRILARAEEMLSIDGLTTEEQQGLLEQGLAWGIYTQQAVDDMIRIQQEADALVSKYNSIPTNITTTITTMYSGAYTPGSGAFERVHGYAQGGSFIIPSQYGNEGYPLGPGKTASAGETVTVTPKGESSGFDEFALGRIIEKAFTRAMNKAG